MTSIDTIDHDDWLAEIRARLQETWEAKSVQLLDLTAAVPDAADADAHAAFIAKTQQAITDTAAALGRLDGGQYGVCERCGRQIPRERLEAIPHVRTCVSCPRS
jgi:RNA polymerase-binding transcription factor DksA